HGVTGGVEHRPTPARIPLVDPQSPGTIGRLAVDLVVEPVAPAAEGLRDEHPRGRRVGDVEEAQARLAGTEPGTEGAEGDRAPDAESALPDLQGVDRVPALPEVGLRGRDDVVQPAADDPEGDRPHRDVEHHPGLGPPVPQPPVTDPDREEDPREDAQGVCVDGERAELDDPDGRRREDRRHHCWSTMSFGTLPLVRILANFSVSKLSRLWPSVSLVQSSWVPLTFVAGVPLMPDFVAASSTLLT